MAVQVAVFLKSIEVVRHDRRRRDVAPGLNVSNRGRVVVFVDELLDKRQYQ